jgi:hypothetical protein
MPPPARPPFQFGLKRLLGAAVAVVAACLGAQHFWGLLALSVLALGLTIVAAARVF